MANGIVYGINSKEDQEEMEENRGRMNRVKMWFRKAAIIEAVCLLYLFLGSILHWWVLVPGIFYIYNFSKKDETLCKRATLVHIAAAVIVIVSAISYCVVAFTSDTSHASVIPPGLTAVLTSVPAEIVAEGQGNKTIMDLLMGVVKTFTVINLIISSVLSLLPVWIGYKSAEYCRIHDELKECNGYPHFHPEIALMNAAEDIQHNKDRRVRSDAASAVTNAQLMNQLRSQNVDFSDTSALLQGVISNSESSKKKSSAALAQVEEMFRNNSHYRGRDDRVWHRSSYGNTKMLIQDTVNKYLQPWKENSNAPAMNALMQEAERLRERKAALNNMPGSPGNYPERTVGTWGDNDNSSLRNELISDFDAPVSAETHADWGNINTELEKEWLSDLQE